MKDLQPTDVRALFAQAREISSGRPGGALRLMLMRLRRNRPEDAGVRDTVGRVISDKGLPAPAHSSLPLPQLLRRRGYRPLSGNGRVWLQKDRRS
jgi:hypothetical protein